MDRPQPAANAVSDILALPSEAGTGLPAPAPAAPATVRMMDLPSHERPRERLANSDPESISNAELIAILLRTGMKGKSALATAHELLVRFKNLNNLAVARWQDVAQVKGIGRDKAVTLVAAFQLARRMARELRDDDPILDHPERVAAWLREDTRFLQVEHFQIILLNTRRRLIRIERISQGTLDTTLVHPREVFRHALAANASSIVLVHNHPSGDPTPSEADIRITRDLIRAGQLLKIEVADHVILGKATKDRPKDYCSLRELGHFHA